MVVIRTSKDLGGLIRKARKAQGLTQPELAASAGVGVRFIVDLEKGKETCELGKALHIAHMLGLQLTVMGE